MLFRSIILGNALYSLAVALFLEPAGLITGGAKMCIRDRCNPLHEVDAGSRNPYAGAKRLRGLIRSLYI